ncbi:MAG: hypothetical protein ACFWUC_01905 [Oscillospiraceae bacterium]|jgi:hypothetical protein
MNVVLKLLKPFITVILGIILTNSFNISNYFAFIPSSIKYETALTIYTGFFNILFEWLIQKFEESLLVKVECIFYTNKDTISINSIPLVKLNKDDFGKIFCKIMIKGNPKRLLHKQLSIYFPDWVDVQSNGVADVENGRIIIRFYKMLTNAKKDANVEREICISMLRSACPDNCLETIEARLENRYGLEALNKLFCKYSGNSFQLKN